MTEMEKLRKLLDEAGIPWVDATCDVGIPEGVPHIVRTQSPTWMEGTEPRWSVICGPLSVGYQESLLELWFGGKDDPDGYLTADEVLEKIRKALPKSQAVHQTYTATPINSPIPWNVT